MTISFTGANRKNLAGVISNTLCVPSRYCGMPSAAYEIGPYRIDKDGTLTGPDDRELVATLCGMHGFTSATEEYDNEGERVAQGGSVLADEVQAKPVSESAEIIADVGEECADTASASANDVRYTDEMVVDVPLDGFTPEAIDRLCKMVAAKEVLLKKALGAEELPIQVLGDRVSFPWFKVDSPEQVDAYATFIAALCKTAKEKKRVTAKAKEVKNPKYSLRCFLLSLGMIGREFSASRRIILKDLEGSSAWRDGPPVPADIEVAQQVETAADDVKEAIA